MVIPDQDLTYLKLACDISEVSPDPSTQCGAVIIRPDGELLSMGWNRFPARLSRDPSLYWDRPEKYKRITHAEVAAILTARADLHGCWLYTWPPGPGPTCRECALAVIESGITRVCGILPPLEDQPTDSYVGRWEESCNSGLALYSEARVDVVMHPWESFIGSEMQAWPSKLFTRFWNLFQP